jgi:hypothetical protein
MVAASWWIWRQVRRRDRTLGWGFGSGVSQMIWWMSYGLVGGTWRVNSHIIVRSSGGSFVSIRLELIVAVGDAICGGEQIVVAIF